MAQSYRGTTSSQGWIYYALCPGGGGLLGQILYNPARTAL